MRFFSRRLGDPDVQQWQPRLYLHVIGLVLIGAYVIAFVLENRMRVSVHFVFLTAHVSLIWLILLSLAIGVLGGVLLSQVYRRRRGT
ncbi:MAG: lipopolysaccharide assembly protein LapA domain-containing protein [Actinomycetota bacterium]|nr:lipopolysaccharide assembly protein LapA domain-containing protein [Actinomycetota bacterium]